MKLTHFAILVFIGVIVVILAELDRRPPNKARLCDEAMVNAMNNPGSAYYEQKRIDACK